MHRVACLRAHVLTLHLRLKLNSLGRTKQGPCGPGVTWWLWTWALGPGAKYREVRGFMRWVKHEKSVCEVARRNVQSAYMPYCYHYSMT